MEVREKKKMRLAMLKDLKSRGQINFGTTIYKNVTTRYRITKMPLLGLKCWPIHLDEVEMTWQLSLSEDSCPSSKIASVKYLKIIKNEN